MRIALCEAQGMSQHHNSKPVGLEHEHIADEDVLFKPFWLVEMHTFLTVG
jgi:hypothetical protein